MPSIHGVASILSLTPGFAEAMAMMRGLHLAATLSLLGTAGFIAWMLPAGSVSPLPPHRGLTRLWLISGLVALLGWLGWFVAQAASIADAADLSELAAALPVVAGHTRYGAIMMLRFGLLVAATFAALLTRSKRRPLAVYAAIVLTAIGLGLQGLIGHAGATGGIVGYGLILSEALHLFAAGIWLGALLPLWLSLRTLAPAQAAFVCERFSPIGLACVLVLGATGFAQGLQLIGSLPALFGTQYGRIALLKIALFLLALLLAAVNRLGLTDRLAAGAVNAREHLRTSICLETCAGLAIVTAAAFMASSPPAAHTTPVWPFPWRFSLVTVNEDPDFRREVIVSLLAIGGAGALMAAALLWRRFRLVTLAVLAATVALRGPSIALLTVEAYPTSFQSSPTGFAAASIVRGQLLFAQNCAGCHGAQGEGNGPVAAHSHIKPADLTAPHIWEHSDGEMFWWLTHGIDDPEGGLAMPGFGSALSADDRWSLIDYVRAHNAGIGMQQDATFDVPVPAPAFAVNCAGVLSRGSTGSAQTMSTTPLSTTGDLHGWLVHVVADVSASIDLSPQTGVAMVNLTLRDNVAPAPGSCAAADAAAWDAYAILAGVLPDKLPGAEFLVDPAGWLRAVRRPDSAGAWHTGEGLIAAIRDISANPIKSNRGQHEHHH